MSRNVEKRCEAYRDNVRKTKITANCHVLSLIILLFKVHHALVNHLLKTSMKSWEKNEKYRLISRVEKARQLEIRHKKFLNICRIYGYMRMLLVWSHELTIAIYY